MKLDEINSESISKVSNQELLSLHHRIHQLRGSISTYKESKKIIELKKKLIKSHEIVVREISKRKFKHQSTLLKKEVMEMTTLDRFFEEVVTEEYIFGGIRGTPEEKKVVTESKTEKETIPYILEKAELSLEKKKWIPKDLKKGALHKQLGVPEDKKIPAKDLTVKPGDSPKLKKRKILAKTFKKMAAKRKK